LAWLERRGGTAEDCVFPSRTSGRVGHWHWAPL
jgi:hypothetical protein